MSHLQPARFHAPNSEGAVTERERDILSALRRGFEGRFQDQALSAPAWLFHKGRERLDKTSLTHCRIVLLIRWKCYRQRWNIDCVSARRTMELKDAGGAVAVALANPCV